jgi:hypothetical protein
MNITRLSLCILSGVFVLVGGCAAPSPAPDSLATTSEEVQKTQKQLEQLITQTSKLEQENEVLYRAMIAYHEEELSNMRLLEENMYHLQTNGVPHLAPLETK